MKKNLFLPDSLPAGLLPYAQFFDRYRRELETAFQNVYTEFGVKGCIVSLVADQTISPSTEEEITFDTETADTSSMIAVPGTDITIPVDGVWVIVADMEWVDNAPGTRYMRIYRNAVLVKEASGSAVLHAETIQKDTAGVVYTLVAYQTSPIDKDVLSASMIVRRFGGA